MSLSALGIRRAFDALSSELARGDGDVDVLVLKPAAAVLRDAAARVARQLELPEDWLNDAAKGFLVGITEGPVLHESDFLLARAPSTAQLLAMKLAAWRDAIDRDDARLLLSKMTGSMHEVWAVVEPFVLAPQKDKASYAFEDLWEAMHGTA